MSGNPMQRGNTTGRHAALPRVLAVLCLLAAVGCTQRWVGTGVVVDKTHEEARVSYRESCTPAGPDGETNCTQTPVEHPARWTLTVRDDEGNDHVVRVRESTFLQCEVGHNYTISYRHCDAP